MEVFAGMRLKDNVTHQPVLRVMRLQGREGPKQSFRNQAARPKYGQPPPCSLLHPPLPLPIKVVKAAH